jgi:chromosome segregation ATPase
MVGRIFIGVGGMRFPFVSRERFDEMKSRAEWAETELRKVEAAALTAKVQLMGSEKALAQLEKDLDAKRHEIASLEDLLASQPTVETMGTEEARTAPAPKPAPERTELRVLTPGEVTSRATIHRNMHRAGAKKAEPSK